MTPPSQKARRRSELPVGVRGEEEGSDVVIRADDVAATAERDRCRSLLIHVEGPGVHVLRRDAPEEGLAHLVLAAHAEAPGRVRRQQR